jgi:hypothetical protein
LKPLKADDPGLGFEEAYLMMDSINTVDVIEMA